MSKYTRTYCENNKIAVRVKDKEEFERMILFTRGPNRGYNFPGKDKCINA